MKIPIPANSLYPLLGIAATSLAVGFGTGRMTAPSESPIRTAAAPVTVADREIRTIPAASPVADQTNAPVVPRRPTRDDLTRILGTADPSDRSKGLDALLAKADEGEVKQLLDWVEAMPESAAKRVALGKVMQKWGELDGAAAAAHGVDAYQQTGNASLLRSALLGWASADPASSIQYLQGLGLGRGLSNDFSRDILGVWSNANPQAAASYLQANPAMMGSFGGFGSRGGGAFGSAASVVAGNWAAQDPRAAAAWAQSLPAGPQQGGAMNQVLRNWVAQDPSGAVSFVNSQPAGSPKDGMVSSLARGLAADDPSSAMKWVGSIGDQGIQTRTAMGVMAEAGVFTQNGPDIPLAQSLISDLPDSLQKQVLGRLTNGGGGRPGR